VIDASPTPSRLFNQKAVPAATAAAARSERRPERQARKKSVNARAVALAAAVSCVPERAIHQYSGAVARMSAAIPALAPTARASAIVTSTPSTAATVAGHRAAAAEGPPASRKAPTWSQ